MSIEKFSLLFIECLKFGHLNSVIHFNVLEKSFVIFQTSDHTILPREEQQIMHEIVKSLIFHQSNYQIIYA